MYTNPDSADYGGQYLFSDGIIYARTLKNGKWGNWGNIY